MKNRCWSLTLLYKSRIIVWQRVQSLNNFLRCWKENTCSITKKKKKVPQNNPKKNDLIWENAHGEGEMSIVFGMKQIYKMVEDINFPRPTFILWSKIDLISFDISESRDSFECSSCAQPFPFRLFLEKGRKKGDSR